MTKLIELIVITLTVASLLSLLLFIFIIFCEVYDWMESNKIITKWLDKMFKAGKQND